MESAEAIERFDKFVESLKPGDRTGILFHRDADGICSAAICFRALSKLGLKPVMVCSHDYTDNSLEKVFEKVKAEKVSKLVIVDLGIDQYRKKIKKLENHAEILFIDHHKVYNNLQSKKTTFIKAEFLTEMDPSKYVASKMCFDLFSRKTGAGESEWIACIGILGDKNYETWKGFFQKTIKRTGSNLEQLREAMNIVNAVSVVKPEKFEEFLLFLQACSHPKDVVASGYSKYWTKLSQEVESLVSVFPEKAEQYPEIALFFYKIESLYKVKSTVVNEISDKNPGSTVIVLRQTGDRVNFSARRQDFKFKCNQLLEKAVANIPNSSAGGHVPAAAGSIPFEHLNKFKENVIQILKEGGAVENG